MDGLCKFCHQLFRNIVGIHMKKAAFINGMRFFVCFLNACPMYVVSYEMLEHMPNKMDVFIYKFLLNFFCSMSLISYWTASLRKSKNIPNIHDNHCGNQDQENSVCGQCKLWKPDRAHHCKYCGKCVLKMDHHCPWIGNCVGYHNLKPFFLFCFYQMLSAITFTCILIEREFYSEGKIPRLSNTGFISFWVTNILDLPIGFSLIGLSIKQFLQIYQNQTSLEGTGRYGVTQNRYPCIGVKRNEQRFSSNKYDMLWPYNIKSIFGSSPLVWWIPFYQQEQEGNGFFHPQLPNVSDKQTGILYREQFEIDKIRPLNLKLEQFKSELDKYSQKAVDKYSGYMLALPGDNQNEQNKYINIPF